MNTEEQPCSYQGCSSIHFFQPIKGDDLWPKDY
jgi:hypothetical protein